MRTKHRAMVGAFVLGGVVLFGAGLFLIGERRLLFEPRFELNTSFGRVSGLQVGTKVRVAGFDAGEVLEVQIPPRPSARFQVRMRLREDLRPLVRTDSMAAIQTDGIVGSAFIQIGVGTDAAPAVEPGDTIAGQDPVEFADLIQEGRQTFQTVTREIVDLTGEVSDAIAPLIETAHAAARLLDDVGGDVRAVTESSARAVEAGEALLEDVRGMVADVRQGQGTLGRLLTDDAQYQHWVGIAREAEQTVANLRAATEQARGLVDGLAAGDGQRIVRSLRDTLGDAREVIADLAEGTEALKRNFLFRGFFRERGFYDLDAITREAYIAGALEGRDRTALRVWIDAEGLFVRGADGAEQLSDSGRRRLESAMADLVRFPRDSPLVVEGYAEPSAGDTAYLVAADRALVVRDFLVSRFRRRVTLTGVMPMADQAEGSPSGDRWSGVALAMFVRNDALATAR